MYTKAHKNLNTYSNAIYTHMQILYYYSTNTHILNNTHTRTHTHTHTHAHIHMYILYIVLDPIYHITQLADAIILPKKQETTVNKIKTNNETMIVKR